MDIWMILQRAVALYPDKTAVVDGDLSFTYAQVGERVEALALFFQEKGIKKGDRIAVLEFNSYQYLEAYFAAAGVGAILCPLNYRLSAREIAFVLNDAGAKWLIANSSFSSLVGEVIAEKAPLEGILWLGRNPSPSENLQMSEYEDVIDRPAEEFHPSTITKDSTAHLYYTSGTTGEPKGVMLTYQNICTHALGTIAELKLADSDVWGHIAPMFHLADAWAVFAITWAGGRHVMVKNFDPETVMQAIERHRITISNLIPTMLNLMVKHSRAGEYDYSSFRVILSGGAPIAPELVRSIMDTFGCDYIQTYGMTETSPYLTLSILKEHLLKLPLEKQMFYKVKTGRPFIAVDLKVVDPDGLPVAGNDEQVGEIWVKGDTVTPGYWNRPEETEKTFRQGWLCTGDLAVVDFEGYVNIVDRKKDMIVSGGENIYSIEVENALYMHPKILEAAVFGVPDPKWGEAVKAAVVLKEGERTTAEELLHFCKQHLSSYKAPKSVVFLKELPKTGSGKIYKKGLKGP